MSIAAIIINFQNSEDTIECLESIIKVADFKGEIILIENGSKDDSVKILRDYIEVNSAKIEFIVSKTNLGFASGCNLGIRKAIFLGCDSILLLNNDTVVAYDFFHELEHAISEKPNAILSGALLDYNTGKVACSIGEIRSSDLVVKHTTRLPTENYHPVTFISGGLMVIPTKVISSVGYFRDDFFMYCEDQEFCYRAKQLGIPMLFSTKVFARHKVAASSRKNKVPRAYYGFRNQTRIVVEYGSYINKIYYLLFLISQIPGLIMNPKILNEFIIGVSHGFLGNLGRYKEN